MIRHGIAWMSITGRFIFAMLGIAGAGLLTGLAVGAWRAVEMVAALSPPPPVPPPGAGFAPGSMPELEAPMTWVANLLIHGTIGFVGGLIVGIAGCVMVASARLAMRPRTHSSPPIGK